MAHLSVHSVAVKLLRDAQDAAVNGIALGKEGEFCKQSVLSSFLSLFRECQVKNWKKHKPSCDILYQSKSS